MPSTDPPALVLASSSPHRRGLLSRLAVPFVALAPNVDETQRPGETPREYVLRLAEEKARAVAAHHPGALIIGCDQTAVLDGAVLSKPGTQAQAAAQLRRASGRRVLFFTGLCLLNTASGRCHSAVEPFQVHFRALSDQEIQRYLQREPALDAAGSFYAEGLGIALFERLEGEDPTALIGLPLIRLCALLRREGIALP